MPYTPVHPDKCHKGDIRRIWNKNRVTFSGIRVEKSNENFFQTVVQYNMLYGIDRSGIRCNTLCTANQSLYDGPMAIGMYSFGRRHQAPHRPFNPQNL